MKWTRSNIKIFKRDFQIALRGRVVYAGQNINSARKFCILPNFYEVCSSTFAENNSAFTFLLFSVPQKCPVWININNSRSASHCLTFLIPFLSKWYIFVLFSTSLIIWSAMLHLVLLNSTTQRGRKKNNNRTTNYIFLFTLLDNRTVTRSCHITHRAPHITSPHLFQPAFLNLLI